MKLIKQLANWLIFNHFYHMADDDDIGGGDDDDDGNWFPEDWRQQIAGDDEKGLAQLGRYKTPADVWTKARALEQRITSGELKEVTAFPGEGTDEEKGAWRTLNNIPEAADKYTLTRELDDTAKSQLEGFFNHAHANNFNNDSVNSMLDYFYQKLEGDDDALDAADKDRGQATEDALRVEWGKEYRAHMNRIEGLMDLVGEGAGEALQEARMPDGSMLKDNAAVQKFLLDMALTYNPAGTLTPGEGGNVHDSIEDEIESIKKVMKTDRKAYNADDKMQARYRELLAAQNSAAQRRGAAA